MKLLVRVTREAGGVRASCVDRDWSAIGEDEAAALAALRASLVAHYTRVRSVAPPEEAPEVEIELEVVP